MIGYLEIAAFMLFTPILAFLSYSFFFVFEFTLFTDIIAISKNYHKISID